MPADSTEYARLATLNANRYRLAQDIRKNVRENLLQDAGDTAEADTQPEESTHKQRLAFMKAAAIRQANKQAGGTVGASVGGTIGSVIPVIGTGIGIFLGRFIGKKLGIIGIIAMALLTILLFFVLFVAILQAACEDTLFAATDFVTTGICPYLK